VSSARLILMRHAKSDWSSPGQPDFERPLSARGHKSAPQMGRWLREQGLLPDVVVSSPARRARETAVAVAAVVGIDHGILVWDDRIYEAGVNDLLAVIREHCGRCTTALLVGHNPGLDDLLCHLSSRAPPLSASGKLLTTGAVAVLAWKQGHIGTDRHGAELEYLQRPRDLPGHP